MIIQADHLTLFSDRDKSHTVFEKLSFDVQAGSTVAIRGPSGSGKTALLLSLCGLEKTWLPDSTLEGLVEIDRHQTGHPLLNQLALVTENPYAQISGLKTRVLEEIAVPLEMKGIHRLEMRLRCERAASAMGLQDHLESRLEHLSGGELVRMHIASGLAALPGLFLLDQVFSELDLRFQERCVRVVSDYVREVDGAAIFTCAPGEVPDRWFDQIVDLPVVKTDQQIDERQHRTRGALRRRSNSGSRVVVTDLWFRYPAQSWLLQQVDFTLSAGDLLIVLGPNGSGKTTLFKLMAGIERPERGSINIMGRSSHLDGSIGMAFQNPDISFCAPIVKEELQTVKPGGRLTPANAALLLGLESYLEWRIFDLPRHLRKRLSLAVAACVDCTLVLLDEPSQYQDEAGVDRIIGLIEVLLANGSCIMCTSHDRRLIKTLRLLGARELNLGSESYEA